VTRDSSIDDAIPAGASVLIDTSVALAYLTGTEEISPLATDLFDGCLATGRNPGALSTVTAMELLVRPFRAGPSAVGVVQGFLAHFDGLRLLPVDDATAVEAARIRALAGFAAPDALIVASFLVGGFGILVTNDTSWPARLESAAPGREIVVLGALTAAGRRRVSVSQAVHEDAAPFG
jgi:predicted nucleic acid-binding protein